MPLGIVGGIVSGLFGVGGALIVPPTLTAFFGVRQVEGQGLGLALVAPGSVDPIGQLENSQIREFFLRGTS